MDTRQVVEAHADLSHLPASPVLEQLLERCVEGKGSEAEKQELGRLWQARVRHLLLDLGRDPGVFVVRPAELIKRTLPSLKHGWSSRSPLPMA
ncbi:MAG: hypothetical protein ABIS05_08175 [Roseateles sp.]